MAIGRPSVPVDREEALARLQALRLSQPPECSFRSLKIAQIERWENRVNGNPVSCQRLANGNTFIATVDGLTEITIAPGTQPGSVTTLRGHGMPHLRSGVRGDLHAHMLVGQAGQRQRQVRDDIEEVDHPEAAVDQQVERHHEVVPAADVQGRRR